MSQSFAFSRLSPIVAALAVTGIVGCSFQLKAGSDPRAANNPNTPNNPSNPSTPAPTSPTGPAVSDKPAIGLRRIPRPTPPTVPPAAPTTPTPTPTNPTPGATITANTPFGSATPDPTGWKGSVYLLASAPAKMPDLGTLTPQGAVFVKDLNIADRAFTEGFPGIDPRTTNFAIRYEAPLVVENEADYDFRIVSDDGAIVKIDGTPIVDNDGVHTVKEAKGPVHLVKGTHLITVDYFQAAGNVALQLYCKRPSMTEQICPTKL